MTDWIDLAEVVKKLNNNASGQTFSYNKLIAWCGERGVVVVRQGERNLVRENELADMLFNCTTNELMKLTEQQEN